MRWSRAPPAKVASSGGAAAGSRVERCLAVVGPAFGSPDAPSVRMHSTIRPLRVLVIDDDAALRDVLREMLTFEGYEVGVATDGRNALDEMERGTRPDAILSDLHMPGMDGQQFILEIRKRPEWASIPVVLLSGSRDIAASAPGAFRVLEKPVSLDRLFATLSGATSGRPRTQPGSELHPPRAA